MTTLEELSRKHGTIFIEEKSPGIDRVAFTFDQLRALITEAVGIVQGAPVAYLPAGYWEDGMDELHHNDMERLK